jgi:hypothetical protein
MLSIVSPSLSAPIRCSELACASGEQLSTALAVVSRGHLGGDVPHGEGGQGTQTYMGTARMRYIDLAMSALGH